MIKITIKNKVKGKWIFKDLLVYEREEELPDDLIVKDPGLVQKDEYIKTHNGYYVPIIERKTKALDGMVQVHLYTVSNNYWTFKTFPPDFTLPIRYKIYYNRNEFSKFRLLKIGLL